MKILGPYRVTSLLGFALVHCALSGCGRADRSEMDILPSQDKARAALAKALAVWENGQKPGKIQGNSHSIQVVDNVWQAGGQLAAFEILQAEDKPGPRWFSVKLTMKDSGETQQVRYAVLGLDPLWVYREEDFLRACGMGETEQ